ncbi:C25 family cysteine peptidase [Rufibacter sp. XAAS-G3-1]|uniref:putative type IX secretion system sortase PorU2 n=1 Tax=Rufibacter sp. XAAS-G3-1 TaxID=2729134 RepID=UPI0015E63ED8|nr:C25 family cysteine peptidase [Rufibacter sp. XAAS-G3-1]
MKTPYHLKFLLFTAFVSLALLGAAPRAYGQQITYGNEWINFSQKYYKMKVPTTGIYRLNKAYLEAAGINGIDPRNFQLYRRGQEVSIHVEGEADGSFDANDYIEFYGEQNDGALDRELYKNPTQQLNPYYSLYTDTAAYFLTWSTVRGKRMVLYNQELTGLTPEPWHMQEKIFFDNGQYSRGKRYGENYMSWMDVGEGFTGGTVAGWTYTLPDMATNLHSGGPAPKIEIAFAGANNNNHEIDIFVRPPSGAERLVGTVRVNNDEAIRQEFTLEANDFFSDGKLVIRTAAKNAASRFRLPYFKTVYPQRNLLTSSGLSFKPSIPTSTPSYYIFEGSTVPNAIGYDITALGSIKRIAGAVTGAQKGFVFPASFQNGILWSGANLVPLPAREVKFRSVAGNQANYLIISHQSLMLPSGSSTNPVRDYAAYRASAAGGGYDTLTMEVGQLYDQFFYGDKSSAAIRRYMKFMIANGKPEYLFILGKGLEADNVNVRKNPSALAFKDLVPVGGTPGSDVFFTSDWEVGNYVPKVATGRLPAQTATDVMAYLNKVKSHEALPQNLEWRKNILHLGGGQTVAEGKQFRTYLNNYELIAEKQFLGADVKTKARENTQNVEALNVSSELNNGLSLITFFGHSSSTASDLDIGFVSNPIYGYNNRGKYPMILMNGCNAGNVSTTATSFGEDWLLTPEKGAILFLAHTSYGYPSILNVFSRTFYEVAFASKETFGKPMGIIHKETVRQMDVIGGDNVTAMLMQMDLKGDPAVVLVGPEKPDYAITNGSISLKSIDGRPLSAASEKLSVLVDVKNLGKAVNEPFYIRVKRFQENGELLQADSVEVPYVYYRDTIEVTFDSKVIVPGANYFEVKVDSDDKHQELEESNNTGRLDFFLPASSVVTLAPKKYGIVGNRKVKLIGQSSNLLSSVSARYYFEVDTTATFKSPWKKASVVGGGLLPVWEIELPANTPQRDSVVYFWRFRNNEIVAPEDTVWATSSFRYIPESSPGWSQSNFAQLAEASLQNMERQEQDKRINFTKNISKTIRIRGVGGNIHFGYPPYSIYIEGVRTIHSDCNTDRPNILAVVFNDKTLEPFKGMPSGTAWICGVPLEAKISYHFGDLRSPENLLKLEEFLKSVPSGYYVAMVGMSKVPYSSMSTSLKNEFKNIGSSLIDQLTTGDPFAIIGRKGAKAGTVPEIGPAVGDPTPAADQSVFLEDQIKTASGEGMLTSSIIGPARAWKQLNYRLAAETSDSYQLDVIGIAMDGDETKIHSNVSPTFNLASVNTAQYPFLKLKLAVKDIENRTAPHLNEWMVLYDEVPEGVLRPDLIGIDKYTNISDQASGGEVMLRYAFQNITDIGFTDSLTVRATLFKEDGSATVQEFKAEPLLKNDTVYFKHAFSTVGMAGTNRIRINVNPQILPEQNYFNNTLELPFTIGTYNGMPPVVDVVFDGARILDGDIVSPSPMISIMLKDNSGKLAVKQSQLMRVYLTKPGASIAEEIFLGSNPDVRMFPADDKNDLRVEFNPKKLINGNYTLEVQGIDAKGNQLGGSHKVNFEVINESTISNFYPYPNPFSSKTRFIFTLTGSTVPDKMKLQIMTVTGKVIREIQKEELGPIKIGNNVSEFAWDGTDEFGDRLANGVYLYRVVMDSGAEETKHRYTAGDKAFKKGYGKIYILR